MSRAHIRGEAGRTPGREGRGLVARLALPALLATLGSWALATPAHAYVRYQLEKNNQLTGVYEQWKQTCIPLVVYPNDLATEMTSDEVVGAASAAADAWSKVGISGTYLDIQINTSLDVTPTTGQDTYHDIVFKNHWCDLGDTTCQTDALAITSVWAGQTSGTIVDADIEVNAENDFWADLVTHPSSTNSKQDLQNALTHEMGHLIGLDHNCYTQGMDPVHMVDNAGMLVPACTSPDADINDVMYVTSAPGDISKRTLKPDDIQAVLDIYPLAKDPHVCPPIGTNVSLATSNTGCQCAVDASPGTAGALPGLALLLGLALRGGRRARAG